MKVKCIGNDDDWLNLTIGKIYEVIGEDEWDYRISNDRRGDENWYEKIWFKPAVSEIRNDKINKLFGE